MTVEIYPCKNHSVQTVVLSSGLGGHANFWQPQIEALREYFQVICYDHEGIGSQSPELPENYSIQHLAEQLAKILKQHQQQNCHFIGHALGGFIGIELVRLYHELVNRLVLINAWDRLDSHTEKCFSTRIALLRYAGIEAYIRAQALFLYPPAWISAHSLQLNEQENKMIGIFAPLENVFKRLHALQNYQPFEVARQIQNPTLVLTNQDDFLVPWKRGLALAKLIKNAELELMPNGGHASTITQAQSVNEILIKFLTKTTD